MISNVTVPYCDVVVGVLYLWYSSNAPSSIKLPVGRTVVYLHQNALTIDGFFVIVVIVCRRKKLDPGASRLQAPVPTCQRVYSFILKFEQGRYLFYFLSGTSIRRQIANI